MGYDVSSCTPDSIVEKAIGVAADGCNEIDSVLADIRTDSVLGDNGITSTGAHEQINGVDVDVTHETADASGKGVLDKYHVTVGIGGISISNAAGAMVIDDLMQKISTKVQVAAQMLATSNNIAKMVARKLDQ